MFRRPKSLIAVMRLTLWPPAILLVLNRVRFRLLTLGIPRDHSPACEIKFFWAACTPPFSLAFIQATMMSNDYIWHQRSQMHPRMLLNPPWLEPNREAPMRPAGHVLSSFPKVWIEYRFSRKVEWKCQSFSRVWLFVTPQTVALPGSSVHGILHVRILE